MYTAIFNSDRSTNKSHFSKRARFLGLSLLLMFGLDTAPEQAFAQQDYLHQVVVFDNTIVQRTRQTLSGCGADSDQPCWSTWFQPAGLVPPGDGQITAIATFTINTELNVWVVRTVDDASTLYTRKGDNDWITRSDLPGSEHGPITNFTTYSGDGISISQGFWRGTGADDTQRAYHRTVNPQEVDYEPGDASDPLHFDLLGGEADAHEMREAVKANMRKSQSEYEDWLSGPITSHTLYPDHVTGKLIQALWIDSPKGDHGFYRKIAINDGAIQWGCTHTNECPWTGGPISDWKLGNGQIFGQTYYSGPLEDILPLNNLVRFEDDDLTGVTSFCNGTLVNPEWVLTAAHCFYDFIESEDKWVPIDLNTIQMRLNSKDGTRGIVYAVSEPIFAPDWIRESPTDDNLDKIDYALVKLATPVNGLWPAPLSFATPDVSQILAATGWVGEGFMEDGTYNPLPPVSPGRFFYSRFDCPWETDELSQLCFEPRPNQIPAVGGHSGMGWKNGGGQLTGILNASQLFPLPPYEFALITDLSRMWSDLSWSWNVLTDVKANHGPVQDTWSVGSKKYSGAQSGACATDGIDIPPRADATMIVNWQETQATEAKIRSLQIGNHGDEPFSVVRLELDGESYGVSRFDRGGDLAAGGETSLTFPEPKTADFSRSGVGRYSISVVLRNESGQVPCLYAFTWWFELED